MIIDPQISAFPLSAILAAVLIVIILLLKGTRVARIAGDWRVTAVLICLAAVATAVEGTWAFGLYHSIAFVVLVVLIAAALGFAAMADWKKSSVSGLASHLGLFLVLSGGLFGAADCSTAMMKVYPQHPEHIAVDSRGNVVPLPFEVELKDFSIDLYEDGVSPKQFTSELLVDGKQMQTSVNHPCRYRGYRFYQSGYDSDAGRYSVLRVVRDPWMGVMAVGALLLAAGALLSLRKAWNSWKVLLVVIVLAIGFTALSVARINFGTLMPALRSLWFIPHLIIYMLAYALLALSLIAGVASLFTPRIPSALPGRFMSTASSLLLLGMTCGAVWAQQAWGAYWTWDSKECWAAATWLLTLAATHSPLTRKKLAIILTALAFAAMNVTWYGVNYLPSSSQSLHTYNQQ